MADDKGHGLGILLMKGEDQAPMGKGDKGDDSEDYSPEAKADLAKQFSEASASEDWKTAGSVLEKFVHLCDMGE